MHVEDDRGDGAYWASANECVGAGSKEVIERKHAGKTTPVLTVTPHDIESGVDGHASGDGQ